MQGEASREPVAILFSSRASANRLVAGVPCAARALRRLVDEGMLSPAATCILAAPLGLTPSDFTRNELARLCPQLRPRYVASEDIGSAHFAAVFSGEAVLVSDQFSETQNSGQLADALAKEDETALNRALSRAGDAILLATVKPGDGMVSRWINRPISRFISRIALRFPRVKPIHGTAAAAIIAIAMFACLILGGKTGLYAGAILFQAASIVDGVDGEIARATFSSSKRGASIDSATDTATNLGFLIGLCINLYRGDQTGAALIGVLGLSLLAIGLALIGFRAVKLGGPLGFDIFKDRLRGGNSPILGLLSKLASRDFYALAFMVLILAGFASFALIAFSVAVSGWFLFICVMLIKTRKESGAS